jgi:hypothetical protein
VTLRLFHSLMFSIVVIVQISLIAHGFVALSTRVPARPGVASRGSGDVSRGRLLRDDTQRRARARAHIGAFTSRA